MAGGSGTRLWPISREGRAKQFAPLLGSSTPLEESYARVRACLPDAQVFVNVTAGNEGWVHRLLPDLPTAHVIAAPDDRDTLPTIGYATLAIEAVVRDPTLLMVASDNWIDELEPLRAAFVEAIDAAQQGPYLVSIGIRPTEASTQYGYMHLGEAAPFGKASYFGRGYFEKPSQWVADQLLAGGCHDWNSGMFCWRASTFWAAVRAYAPNCVDTFEALRASAAPAQVEQRRMAFGRLPRLAVDHGILEQVAPDDAIRHVFVRAQVGWDDLGHYAALARHLEGDLDGNQVRGPVAVERARSCVVLSDGKRDVTVRDVEDLIVVSDSGDVLVAARSSYAKVRELAGMPLWNGTEEPEGHHFAGYVKAMGSRRCVVEGDGAGTVGLIDVEDLQVHVDAGQVIVAPRVQARQPGGTCRPALSARMSLTVAVDERQMSRLAAEHVVNRIAELLKVRERPLVIFSAGKTPLGLFDLLRTSLRAAIDWSRVRVAQMDEYVGVDDAASFGTFLRREIAEPLGVAEFLTIDRTWDAADLRAYEDRLRDEGLDLVVHGIGRNGHLGFNEPGSSFDGQSTIAALAPQTRSQAVEAFGGDLSAVPEAGYSVGLSLLNSAREVVLMAAGAPKSASLREAIFGPVDPRLPASSLQQHDRVAVFADRDAAGSWLRPVVA